MKVNHVITVCLVSEVCLTQDDRQVELSLQKGHFLSQSGHIKMLPPILASHISLLEEEKKENLKSVPV